MLTLSQISRKRIASAQAASRRVTALLAERFDPIEPETSITRTVCPGSFSLDARALIIASSSSRFPLGRVLGRFQEPEREDPIKVPLEASADEARSYADFGHVPQVPEERQPPSLFSERSRSQTSRFSRVPFAAESATSQVSGVGRVSVSTCFHRSL
jgi:hypothetical protein